MHSAIGGFFELELRKGHHPFPDARAYNLARSAFQALLLAQKVRRVWMPHLLCAVMPDAALGVGVEVVRYGLTPALEPICLPSLATDEAFLYVNYFGVKDAYIRDTLVRQLRHGLIVDNSQALFSTPEDGVPTLYSPRKFVGVPDGGWLVNGPDDLSQAVPGTSANRFEALLGRLADPPHAHYAAFLDVEHALGAEGLRGMSAATTRLLDSIDYPHIKRRRQENFSRLHDALGPVNDLGAMSLALAPALCYPFIAQDPDEAARIRETLLNERVYVPCYWREVLSAPDAPALERELAGRLLPLPIDQRYGAEDMNRLAAIVINSYPRPAIEPWK
jgi:hypothetical protein